MTHAQMCTFMVDDLFFGVEVTQVQAVLREQPITRVPLAPVMIRGLLNLRGQIVTAVDLRMCLGLPPRSEPLMNVVIRSNNGGVSLLVDSIGDVLEVPLSEFEFPPPTMAPALARVVDAICKLPGRLLLVLAAERALRASQADAGNAHGPTVLH